MFVHLDHETKERIKNVLSKKEENAKYLRIYIAGLGWGGPKFSLGLDQIKEDDIQEDFDSFIILIEKQLIDDFGGFEINWNGYGYTVKPIEKDTLNC